MSSFLLRTLLSLALLASVPPVAHEARARQKGAPEPSESQEEEPPSESVIYGRAVYDATGRPVRRARVRLAGIDYSGAQNQRTRAALTNANGEFRLTNIDAGNYIVYVEGPGLLTPSSFSGMDGMSGPEGLDTVLTYFERVKVDGKDTKEVSVRAHLGASVAGRVSYDNGDPVPGASVTLKRRLGGGTSTVGSGGGLSVVTTDERGRYRFSSLPPGEYVVYAAELMSHGGASEDKIAPSPVVVTYHPSTPKAEAATVVKAAAGEEVEGVDITIAERETHALSGVVRGRRDGRPLAGARVEFSRRDARETGYSSPYSRYAYGPNVVSTDEQGRWRFEEIPDGEYSIEATPPPAEGEEPHYDGEEAEDEVDEALKRARRAAAPAKKGYAPARRAVSVAGGDVSDVVLTLGDEGRITGSFAVEGGGQLPSNMYVFASQSGGAGEQAAVFAGGTEGAEFVVEGLSPGRYNLHASIFDIKGDGDLYVKSVTWRGRNLLRDALELREGETVEGVVVTFAPGRASARLRVYVGADRTPALGLPLAFLPLDPAQRYRTDLPFCFTDADGLCEVTGPPGEYAVVAYRMPEGSEWLYDEREVEARKAAAPRFTLRAGKPAGVAEITLPKLD